MSQIIISNDFVCGIGGEEVMWNFLCDRLPGAIGVDSRTVKCNGTDPRLAQFINEYIHKEYPKSGHIIQNATFMGFIDTNRERKTFVYLQDNLRKMNRRNGQQEQNLRLANVRVCNSRITAASYPEYNFEIIPIGVNDELFSPADATAKVKLRVKYGLQDFSKIAIFVGSLDEVKGWKEIHGIITKRPDIFFIIVSKCTDGTHNTANSITFTQIKQPLLADLLRCSDFFILGSPVETQCLAAIEACLCGIPVIMKRTGIFMDFSPEDQARCGFFGDNLQSFIDPLLADLVSEHSVISPRAAVLDNDLSINGMIEKWKRILI